MRTPSQCPYEHEQGDDALEPHSLYGVMALLCPTGDGQVDFEEFVTLLGPKLSTSGIPEKFHGTDFDTVFWKVGESKQWEPGGLRAASGSGGWRFGVGEGQV